jgi:hypothetical protein
MLDSGRRALVRPLQTSATADPVGVAKAVVAAIALSLAACSEAVAAPPAPCGGVAQISDPGGDGHHENTDVLSGWFSEQAGRLQAVIKVKVGEWLPAHRASDSAGWAMLFDAGGQTRFVRLQATAAGAPSYDYGTWTLAGGFASAGATTGEVTTGAEGTATIDVRAETGAVPAARLVHPFVLTYEHEPVTPDANHWVDHAPGGVAPDEAVFGADYTVGSCQPPAPDGPVGGGNSAAGPTPVSGAATTTTAVVLTTRTRLIGPGRVRASGRVIPARGGVWVRMTAKARGSSKAAVERLVRTSADGGFAGSIPVSETSTVSAVADGINAQTRVITVQSTVRMTVRRLKGGRVVASGLLTPRLPGRVLLLRTNAATPSATTRARNGHYRFTARRFLHGRYEAVFIPSGDRAERSTSASGAIR